MSVQNRDGSQGFLTSEAIARAIRVKLSAAGTVSAAGAGEEGIGTSYDAAASGASISVTLDNKAVAATASGGITAGNDCYPAASGAVSASINGRRIGVCLASVTDGNKFEMMIAGQTS